MKYPAILFDLDGTLLDTLDDLADSANLALGRLGLPPHKVEAFKNFIGDGIENLVRRVLPEDRRDPETFAECLKLTRGNYSVRWAEKTRPYPGIAELLDALAQRGVRSAVYSNKPDEFTQLCVKRFFPDRGLSQFSQSENGTVPLDARTSPFEIVLGANPTLPRKPAPDGAILIANRFQLEPSQFIYLGDTGTDMQTAVAAGMFPVGALWGFRPAEELTANGARTLIHNPLDLLPILD